MPEMISKTINAIKGLDPMLGIVLVLLCVILVNSYREIQREDRMVNYMLALNADLHAAIITAGKCANALEDATDEEQQRER